MHWCRGGRCSNVTVMAPGSAGTHREQKRQRTKVAIIEAAIDLFEARGYDETTIAEIAAAAGIAPRTFFSYFASKDELVFDGAESQIDAAYAAIAERRPGDSSTEVLLRGLTGVIDSGHDYLDRHSELRFRLIQTVPAVRGRALQIQVDAQREIARLLHAAYSDELDQITAGAMVGAYVGAVTGAIQAMHDTGAPSDPEARSAVLRRAVEAALPTWTTGPGPGANGSRPRKARTPQSADR
jgi:AcrR family transcriptional regulator